MCVFTQVYVCSYVREGRRLRGHFRRCVSCVRVRWQCLCAFVRVCITFVCFLMLRKSYDFENISIIDANIGNRMAKLFYLYIYIYNK